MKIIPLTQGYEAIVDEEDFAYLSQWKWQIKAAGSKLYGFRTVYIEGKTTTVSMHRVIAERMGLLVDSAQIDHVNGKSLDNRRSNLRIASNAQNSMNRSAGLSTGISGYKGVVWSKQHNKWRAKIKVDGQWKHVGLFSDAKEAALAYNAAATKYFGEYANLNQIL